MKLIEAEQKLLQLKQPILQTSDVAAYFKINGAHASKILERLVKAGYMLISFLVLRYKAILKWLRQKKH